MSSKFESTAPIYMRKLISDFGIGVDDAAAIMGNGGHESNGFVTLQEIKPTVSGSAGGWGWFQWTGPRRRQFEAYCKRNHLDPSADAANYAFLFLELKGSEKAAITAVKSAVGLEAKVKAFEAHYERAGVKHYDSRIAWARKALAAFQAQQHTANPPATLVRVPVEAPGIEKPMVKSSSNWMSAALGTVGTAMTTLSGLNPYVQGLIVACIVLGVVYLIWQRKKKSDVYKEAVAAAKGLGE
jgi:hypothetical protein